MKHFNKVKGRMREQGFTQADVAKKLGMSKQAFSNKVNGKTDFKLSELEKLCCILNIADPATYFFAV